MPLSDFRSAHSWQEAIDLGPGLARLAEQLPLSEQMGLAWQLQQIMVELPQAIALDLLQDGSMTRRPASLRLIASLDLIEKIYPALDTAEIRTAADNLVDRLKSDRFTEVDGIPGSFTQTPDPAPAPLPVAPPVGPVANVPVVPEAVPEPEAIPEPLPPAPEPQAEVPHSVPVSVDVPADTDQENHVQTDLVQ